MNRSELIQKLQNLPSRKETGELYFDKLDEIIKNDNELMSTIVNLANYDIVSSGEFGRNLKSNNFPVKIVAPGGIRGSRKVSLDLYSKEIEGKKFTFIDDSYYKGRTLRKIMNEIRRLGGQVVEVIVVYNDSSDPFVESIVNRSDLM